MMNQVRLLIRMSVRVCRPVEGDWLVLNAETRRLQLAQTVNAVDTGNDGLPCSPAATKCWGLFHSSEPV